MAPNTRPVQFLDYLPEVFQRDEPAEAEFFSRFLQPFETLFEELEAEIEGTPGGRVEVTVQTVSGDRITAVPFRSNTIGFPAGTPLTTSGRNLRTTLKEAISPDSTISEIQIEDVSFVAALASGDVLTLHPGGIPDLFHPATAPPPQFAYHPSED